MLATLKKIFAVLAKLVAKEFLWFVTVFILAIPLSLLLVLLSKNIDVNGVVYAKILAELKGSEIMCYGFFYLLSFCCVYFFRMVGTSLKQVLSKKVV